MRKYWMDTDSFITPYRGPYRFQTAPQFWDFIKTQGEQGIVGSPELVLDKELTDPPPPANESHSKADQLAMWAAPLRGILFISADDKVQNCYKQIAQYVRDNSQYKPQWVAEFLDSVDAWVVAYAMAYAGEVVTLEVPQPQAKKPKIPDVAAHFQVRCITIWDMLDQLGFKF